MDELVDEVRVRAFLAATADPAVALQIAMMDGESDQAGPPPGVLRTRISAHQEIADVLAKQAADGSWGDAPQACRRILPTFWTAKTFSELGMTADHSGLGRALEFLDAHTVVEDGGVSINGRPDGVLSCYTGIMADMMLRAGRPDAAAGPLSWIATYQHVRYGGRDYLGVTRPVWGRYLATRYGGCLAGTTCLLGVVKCGLALVRARDAGLGTPEGQRVLDAIRDLLADREVFRRRDGDVIPLGAAPTAHGPAAERWLAPAFPLTYQTDLLEMAQLAVDVDVPAERMTAALTRIAAWRLPDGTWPMLRSCPAPTCYRPERPARRTGSRWITLRVLRLWDSLRRGPA
ncbi:hypothetical protein [Actinoplanes sp. NPDC049802]|uniref:hypothetical protein n=1 Tax=Actinoplanes sp. NPDC049802 TaxID=3154742 RepID=UPI0033E257F6